MYNTADPTHMKKDICEHWPCKHATCDGCKHYKIKKDNINHPSHYETGAGFECKDVMLEVFGKEAVQDFYIINTFKYLYRYKRKNGLEDLRKAKWYLDEYLKLEEK